MPKPGMIVFDNYQDVPETSAFHRILKNGLTMVPEGIRACMVSRAAPPAPLVSLKAQSGLASLGWDVLRFSGDEVRKIVELRKKTKISDETAQRITRETQGWAAAVVLSLDRGGAWSVRADTIGDSSIFDYFKIEVFDKLGEEVRRFLLTTALLPTISAELAARLTGIARSGDILADLHRNNYFTERYGGEYRFHPLFKEFLLTEAERSLTADEMRYIRHTAGKLLLDSGRLEEGIELLTTAQDWQTLVPVLLGAAPRLVAEGRSRTLESLIGTVPVGIRDEVPWLLYWLGVCRLPYDATESRSLADRALTAFLRDDDVTGIFVAWSGATWSIMYAWRLELLQAQITWFEEYYTHHRRFASVEVEAAVGAAMSIALTYGRPSHPDFITWVERSLSATRREVSGFSAVLAYQGAMACYFWLGEYEHLEELLAETEMSALSNEPGFSAVRLYFKSYLVNYTGPFRESPVPFVEQGLQICEKTGLGSWVASFLLVQGALDAIDRGDLAKAANFVSRMESMLAASPAVFHAQYQQTAALCCFRLGELARAHVHVREMVELGRKIHLPFLEAAIYLGAAFILMETGEMEAARKQIDAHKAMPETPSAILKYTCLIAEAALALKEGAPQGLDRLREALVLGRKKGFISPLFSWIPSLMSRLCGAALEAGIEVEHVRHIIKSKNLAPGEPIPNAWPWPVKVQTLGGLLITIDDVPLRFTGKVQKRPLALLKFVVAAGGADVPQELIEDTLWPEAEGDAAHDAFKSALARLRKLLNVDGVIEVTGGKVRLPESAVWTDVRILDRIAEETFRLWQDRRRGPAVTQAHSLALRLAAIYEGDFLKNDDDAWIQPFRDRKRIVFRKTVTRLSDIFTEAGRDELTAILHEHALNVGFSSDELRRFSRL
jgi:LuxR family transcriptional regulator, maltose regulon positive regulatory protein